MRAGKAVYEAEGCGFELRFAIRSRALQLSLGAKDVQPENPAVRISTLLPERRSPTRPYRGIFEKRAGSEIGAPKSASFGGSVGMRQSRISFVLTPARKKEKRTCHENH